MAKSQKQQQQRANKEREARKKRIKKEKTKVYDGGFMARCIAVLIGFIVGIVGTLGGIVGGGYYIAKNKTVRETADLVAGSSFDLSKYLTDEYADLTLLNFFKNLSDTSSKITGDDASLATIAEISPYAQTIAEKLTDILVDCGLEVTTEGIMNTAFNDFSTYFQDSIKASKLGAIVGVEPNGSLLSLLCYGEEGVNYTLDDDGNIVMINGSKQLTVGDLTDNGATTEVFYRISLKAVLATNENASFDDPIVRALLYGTKGTDYILESSSGTDTVVMLPVVYTYENDGTGVFVLTNDHDEVIATTLYTVNTASGIIALFDNAPTSTDDEPSYYLAKNDSDGKYYAYLSTDDLTAGLAGDTTKRVLHKATTLGDLTEGDFTSLLDGLQIGDALGVTADSEAALRTLAYGNKDEDYTIENGEIVMLNGATPRTLKDLKDDESLLTSIYLKDLFEITPEDSNETFVVLAYGEAGKNYTYDKETKTVTLLSQVYTARKVSSGSGSPVLTLYDNNGDKVIDETTTGAYDATSNVWRWTATDTDGESIDYIAKVPDGALGQYTYYIYNAKDEATPITYRYRTLADLQDLDSDELIGGLTLRSAFKINITSSNADSLLIALAYGTEGVNYELAQDSSTAATSVVMKAIEYTATYNEASGAYIWTNENGETITPSTINGTTYEFLRTANGISSYVYAQNVSANGTYALCDAFGNALTYSQRMVSSLKGSKANSVINGIELRTIVKENTDDAITMYLLYGKKATYNTTTGEYENGNYYLDESGKVVLIGSANTIGDLRSGGDDSLISKIRSELTIGELLGDAAMDNKILKNLTDATLDNLSTKINDLKIVDVFEADIYETDASGKKTMKAEWQYLLNDPDNSTSAEDYTINDMGVLMENMKKNIKTKSMAQLNNDFDLELNKTFLAMALDEELAGKSGVIGDLTMSELTDYIPLLMAKLSAGT